MFERKELVCCFEMVGDVKGGCTWKGLVRFWKGKFGRLGAWDWFEIVLWDI